MAGRGQRIHWRVAVCQARLSGLQRAGPDEGEARANDPRSAAWRLPTSRGLPAARWLSAAWRLPRPDAFPPPGAYPPPVGYLPPVGYPPPVGYLPYRQPYRVGGAFSWAWNRFTDNAGAAIVSTLLYVMVLIGLGVINRFIFEAVASTNHQPFAG